MIVIIRVLTHTHSTNNIIPQNKDTNPKTATSRGQDKDTMKTVLEPTRIYIPLILITIALKTDIAKIIMNLDLLHRKEGLYLGLGGLKTAMGLELIDRKLTKIKTINLAKIEVTLTHSFANSSKSI